MGSHHRRFTGKWIQQFPKLPLLKVTYEGKAYLALIDTVNNNLLNYCMCYMLLKYVYRYTVCVLQ